MGEVEQLRKIPCGAVGVTRIWKTCLRVPQFVEEGLHHGIDCRESLCGRVLQQLRDQVDRARISFPEHL